jgi:hypothetical protein
LGYPDPLAWKLGSPSERRAAFLMRYAHLCALFLVVSCLGGCSKGTKVAVTSDDLVTFRLPDQREFQVDIVGEPFTGRNTPFEMAIKTNSKTPIKVSIEDVLYIDKGNKKTYELIVFADSDVFKKNGIALLSLDASNRESWSIGTEPSTWTGKGQAGPEARRISALGHSPYSDFKAVSEVEADSDVVLHLVAPGGDRVVEIESPYRLVGIKHAHDRR